MSDPLRNVEAEQTLLGTILLRVDGLDFVAGMIGPDHFSEPLHGEIYRAATLAKAQGLTPSLMTVGQAMSSLEMPEGFELRPYLARLVTGAVPASMAAEYAEMVVELWRRREIVASLNTIRDAAAKGDVGPISTTALALARDEFGRLESRVSTAGHGREKRLGRISIGEIAGRPVTAPDFVIDGWMIAREQSFMAGEPQSGKSFLALHAAMCIATGRDVLGLKTNKGLVIYQSGESGVGVAQLRGPAWLKHFGEGVDPASTPFELIPARVNLFRPDGNAEEFHQVVKSIAREWEDRYPLRAIFIDTMSKVMSGANENDGRDVGRVLEQAERLSRDTGAHVCLVHHLPKNGTGMRGHGSLKGDTDTVAMISVEETKVRTILFDKIKDSENGGKLNFELMQVDLGARDDGARITSCVVLQVGQKDLARKTAEAKGFALGVNEAPIFDALAKAIKRAGRFSDNEMEEQGVPAATYAVDWDIWKEEYRLSATPEENGSAPTDDLIRKHYKRYGEPMAKRFKIIGRSGRWLWIGNKPVRGYPETYPEKDKLETRDGQPLPSDEVAGAF